MPLTVELSLHPPSGFLTSYNTEILGEKKAMFFLLWGSLLVLHSCMRVNRCTPSYRVTFRENRKEERGMEEE